MQLENFKKLIELIDKQDNKIDAAYKLDIDLIEFSDGYHAVFSILGNEVFTEDGWEHINWWLYEGRHFAEPNMWDKEGNVIPMETVEDLYDYLIKDGFVADDSKVQ